MITNIFFASALWFCSRSESKVLRVQDMPGTKCDMGNGIFGVCEEVDHCMNNNGLVYRQGTLKLCASGKKEKLYVCCRRPFQVAQKLCESWKRHWWENNGKCTLKYSSMPRDGHSLQGEFPEVALVGTLKTWVCGGTIVSPYFVLTAAHCVFRKTEYRVSVGVHDIFLRDYRNISAISNDLPDGLYRWNDHHISSHVWTTVQQSRHISNIIIHPLYDHETNYNDIALLLLEKPIKLTRVVLPACLPSNPRDNFMHKDLFISGWGMTSYFRGISAKPRFSKISAVSSIDCLHYHRKKDPFLVPKGILPSQLCAGNEKSKVCKGDSGSPLITKEGNFNPGTTKCEHTVVGLVSHGYGCGRLSIYTRVSAYVDWITEHIAPAVVP